jgi:hypothetical protein
MNFTGIVRYSDLLRYIPSGEFYASSGDVIPYYSAPVRLRIETDTPSVKFGVYVNGVYVIEVLTDAVGNVEFYVQLPLGEVEIKLYNNSTGAKIVSYYTTRNYATWLAAYAEALEEVDSSTERASNALFIKYCEQNDIEDYFGKSVETYMDFGIALDSYRNLIQELRLGYRNYGSRFGGF